MSWGGWEEGNKKLRGGRWEAKEVGQGHAQSRMRRRLSLLVIYVLGRPVRSMFPRKLLASSEMARNASKTIIL